MKNQIEGIPYNIGDNVKINYRYKLVGDSNADLKAEVMEYAFNITSKRIKFEPIFRVVKMKIMKEFDGGIGVRVKLGNKTSAWMDCQYFKLTLPLNNDKVCV